MDNTNFSSFHENMAFWSLKPYSGINIYLISKLWLFGIHFYHKPQCLLLKKYLPENLKCLFFYITSSKIFIIFQKLQNSCDHICYGKGKKIENFQFLMLKFIISVSNLYMKPIWATFEFFTRDFLPKVSETYSIVHIGFQGTKVG